MIVNVTEIRREGSVAVLVGTTEDGSEVLVAADDRTALAIEARLSAGEAPVPLIVEAWQIIEGGAEA